MTVRTKWQKLIGTLSVLLLLLSQAGAAFADGGGHPLEKEVDGYHVQLVFTGKVVTGANKVSVKLLDAQEKAVSGAEVEIFAAPFDDHGEGETEAAPHDDSEKSDDGHAEDKTAETLDDDHAEEADPEAQAPPESDEHDQAPAENENNAASSEGMGSAMNMAPENTQPAMEMEAESTDAHSEPEAATTDVHDEPEATKAEGEHSEPAAAEAENEHSELEAAETQGEHSAEAMDNILLPESDEPGVYHGQVKFSKAGKSTVTVHFTTPDTKSEIQFEVEVNSRVNKTVFLGGFAGLNAAVIVTAAILKRRVALHSSTPLRKA